MEYYLTFDLGTTSLKTALIDGDGRVAAVHVEEYMLITPQPDWAEMAPETYWQAAVAGTRAVFARSGADPKALAAIGFSSQGQTYVPIDRSGKALFNAIVWVDNRAQGIADEWAADWLTVEEYHRATGYPWIAGGLTSFKLGWMRRHTPEVLKAWKFLCLPDYIIYRLTGETATDHIIAQMNGLYDLRTRTWSPPMMAAAGITAEQLPAILEPGAKAGSVHAHAAAELGILADVPVCVGANDQLVGAIGAGNVRPGIVSETTGTALALVATTEKLLDDNRVFVAHHAVPGLSYAMAFTITSAIVLKWFRDMAAPGMDYDELRKGTADIPPGCGGLTVLPHFAGTASPTYNPNVRGAITGLTLGHTRAHIVRAIMESCACMLQECLECVTGHGLAVTSVRSMGGAAHSDLWLQIKADMLGVPVERPVCTDAGSLGAAMLAAAGIDRFSGVAEAADAWYRHDRVFEPNPVNYAAYREVYGRYLELYRQLYGQKAALISR